MATCPLCKTDLVQKVPDHKAFRCMKCSCYFIILNPAEFSKMMKMKQKLETKKQPIKELVKTPEGVQPVMPPLTVLAAAANRVVDLQEALAEAINLASQLETLPDVSPQVGNTLDRLNKVLTAQVDKRVVDTLKQAAASGQLEELPTKGVQ